MAKRALVGLACMLLAGCGVRDPQPAPLLSITDGRYSGSVASACMAFDFGRRDRQTFILDANCDGAPELQSPFTVTDDVIQTDAGTLTVTAVGPASFSGVWSDGAAVTEARFARSES